MTRKGSDRMLATNEEMQRMDLRAVEEGHVSMVQLMKQAADALFEALCRRYGRKCRYGIFCGSGNNGGDGYALALRMKAEGIPFVICSLREPRSACARHYAQLLEESGEKVLELSRYAQAIEAADVLVDALFGTGLNRTLSGDGALLAAALNASGKPIVAVDIPSGLDGDGTLRSDTVVRASHTVTFECVKKGMLPYSSRIFCGRIECVPIGMPNEVKECADPTIVLDPVNVRPLLPRRRAQSHKGSYGRVLVIGGSRRMSGAVILCTRALLRSGAGLVTCLLPEDIHPIVASQVIEAMYRPVPSDANGQLTEGCLRDVTWTDYDLIVAGNGMGRGEATRSIIRQILDSEVPCLLDGDAIYEAGAHDLLAPVRKKPVLLTPHMRELSYLCKEPVDLLREHPQHSAQAFVRAHPYVTLVAKDDITWICQQERLALSIIGSDALAKGGSGDVLCGMIAGLYAQSKDAFAAACAGVYAHAYAAQQLAAHEDSMSVLASDLIEQLPKTYRSLRDRYCGRPDVL